MSDNQTKAELSLRKLGETLRAGIKASQPLTEKDLECVRQAVCVQWEREEAVRQIIKGAKQSQGSQQVSEQKNTQNPAKSHKKQKPGHGHSQSY